MFGRQSKRGPRSRSGTASFSFASFFSSQTRCSAERAIALKQGLRRRLFVEPLEDRRMLAVTLDGVANWLDLGSSPMISAGANAAPNNPASGGVEDVAVDPNNPARIFVATVNGGIWRTTNGDRPFNGIDDDGANGVDDPNEQPSWEPLTDQFPSLAMSDIRFDPLDPTGNTLFAGTGSTSSLGGAGGPPIGVFRTTDGGDTWSVFAVNPAGTEPSIRSVLPTTFDADNVTPGVQQVVLVGTTSATGLYRSTDGGQNYAPVGLANGLPSGAVTSLIADPNNPSQFFAGVVGQGVYRSTNGGQNWAAVNTNLVNLAGSTSIQLTAHPGGGTTVLHTLISGVDGAANAAAVAFTSNNSGNTWTQLAALPAAFTSSNNGLYTRLASDQLVADPTNSQIVYIGKGYAGLPMGVAGPAPLVMRYNPAAGGSWVQLDSVAVVGNTRPHVDSRDMQFVGTDVLLHANDGGVYFLTNPANPNPVNDAWTSLHGLGSTGLSVTEYTNTTWDDRFNVAVGGAQDNGTTVQNGFLDPIWTQFQGSDGGDVQVDEVNAGAGQVFRYAATQPSNATPAFFTFNRFTFNSPAGAPVNTTGLLPAAGLPNFTPYFVPQFELNTVTPARLAIGGSGTSPVYELLNAATAANAGAANWQAVPVGAGFGNVNNNNDSPIVYGGRLNGADNAEVLIAASGSGVFIRSTAGGTLTATPSAFPGGAIQAIAVNPENWRNIFVADGTGVWETTNAGTAWNNLTRNLPAINSRLQSLSFVPTAQGGVITVGGNLGVSRLAVGDPAAQWSRLGGGLPNAQVNDLEYNAADDVLLAGTFGRGAQLLQAASVVIEDMGILNICGDEDHTNQDDVIRLVRNMANPLVLDVFLNSVAPVFSTVLATISQINVFGVGGNDTLIVDSSNGLINVSDGIRFDGDGACPDEVPGFGYDRGIDTLQLVQTGGPTHTSSTITVGATVGQGISTIVGAGAGNTQTVFFEELEPIIDNVPAAVLAINGATIGSLLNGANQITYDQSDLLGPTHGRVTIDAFEPIHFSNKTALTIDSENGDDVVVLNNAALPTGLETISIDADNGNDVVRVLAIPDASATTFVSASVDGGAGNDVIDAGASTANTPLTLAGGVGDDTITGGAGLDSLTGGDGDDTFIDSLRNDTYNGGAGIDRLIVRGTNARNLIDVLQQAPVAGNYPLAVTNSPITGPFTTTTETIIGAAGLPTVEGVRIEALGGEDTIRVGHVDAYIAGSIQEQTIAFDVDGGLPNTGDRLVVIDDGLGDLVIQRLGSDSRSGSYNVGATATIEYTGIEFASVTPFNAITGGTGTDGAGRLVVFKQDPFESNDSLANAWLLGAGVAINADPTIDPGGFDFPPIGPDPFDVPGDADFFRFVAQETGTLDFQILFKPILTLANGRAGLPGNGELAVTAFDSDGNPLAGIGTATDLLDPTSVKIGERLAIPVVRNQTYYLRITGQTADAINVYTFTSINIAAPVPQLVDLQAASDSGRHNSDDITKITTPTFDIILDDDRLDEFANRDLIPDTVNDDAQTLNNGAGTRIDYGVQVFNNGVSIGFAFYTGVGNTWRFTATAGDLNEGANNFISAAVWIRDTADPAQIGRHELSTPLQVTLDTAAPPVSFGLPTSTIDGVITESDSGVSSMPATFADRITSDTTPRLWGRAEANSIIRVYLDRDDDGVIDLATDTFLGLTVALPYDGNDAYPDGYWELETIDLNNVVGVPRDGLRQLLVTAEDVAGNPMPMANEIATNVDALDIFIDTEGPRVQDVFVTNFPGYDLFDPKPSTSGFTPLVDRITVKFSDLPARIQDFLYSAVKEDLATTIGNYQLVGDHVGNILIREIIFNDLLPGGGGGGPAPVAAGSGGVIVDGGDREEHGSSSPGGDGVLGTADDVNIDGWQFIEQMVNFAATSSQNGGAGILAVGPSGNALAAIQSVATVLGLPLTVTTTGGAVDLATVNFTNFAMMYVPTHEGQTGGGVTTVDLNTLTTRKLDVQNFVNTGGSLVALTEDTYATPYSWLELPAVFTIGSPSSNNQYQTQALVDAGLVITDAELVNGTPLHNTFTGPPGFNGLQPFVYNVGPNGINENGGGDDEVVTLGLGQGGMLGGGAMAEVVLVFDKFLPDDRYTLTVRDSIADIAGNRLDGESQAASPFENSADVFPSGDGVPGGTFNARFTIDSRPEIGSSIAQGIQIDINGNFVWDPANAQIGNDATNVDLAFTLPGYENGELIPGGLSVHDLVVVGKFTAPGAANLPPRLFDQLASYGDYNGVFRWLIDLDSDGAVYGNGDPDGVNDLIVNQGLLPGFGATARAGAVPVAGNFDRNAANGDEIGLYYAGTWALDTNHDYIIDKVITSSLFGTPIVGDFDGDGNDDLAVFNSNQFFFDLTFNALVHTSASSNTSLTWGFPGVLDKPVAADMDQDGIDDIGLWVPRNGPNPPRIIAEWYFLLSGDFDPTPDNGIDNRRRITGTINTLNHPFSPVPFGFDLFAEFGDEMSLPIVGNFDPPVTAAAPTPSTALPGDFNSDDVVDGADFLTWQRNVGRTGMSTSSGDATGDGLVNSADLAQWKSGFSVASAPVASLPGDFTLDGVVDGADLLSWQRTLGTGGASSLDPWRLHFGAAAAPTASASVTAGETIAVFADGSASDDADALPAYLPGDFDFAMAVGQGTSQRSRVSTAPARRDAMQRLNDAALSDWQRRVFAPRDRFGLRGESLLDRWAPASDADDLTSWEHPSALEDRVFEEI